MKETEVAIQCPNWEKQPKQLIRLADIRWPRSRGSAFLVFDSEQLNGGNEQILCFYLSGGAFGLDIMTASDYISPTQAELSSAPGFIPMNANCGLHESAIN